MWFVKFLFLSGKPAQHVTNVTGAFDGYINRNGRIPRETRQREQSPEPVVLQHVHDTVDHIFSLSLI